MALACIIPVLDAERTLPACLEHVGRELRPGDEWIVVDNGSRDRSLEIARAIDRLRIVEQPGVTIGALRNRGARETSAGVLVFVDSDCLPQPGWREAIDAALADPLVAATGSRYRNPADATWIERAWFAPQGEGRRRVGYINSGNLVVRRAAFDAVGGFDERLVTDEDYDLGARLTVTGHAVVECPEIASVHLGNPKRLIDFYRKIRWHATGGTRLRSARGWDKPTLFTLSFIAGCAVALAAVLGVATGGPRLVGLALAAPLVPPLIHALARAAASGLRHLPALWVLFTVYYLARSETLLRRLLSGGGGSRSDPERA